MNQAPKKTTVWQLAYEPLPWVYWVRIVQLVFNVIVLALVAYAASQSIIGPGIDFPLFTTVWSILWIPLITWGTSYIQARHQPNFAVLAIEALTCLWWLVAFAMLASIASGKAFFTGVAGISYSYKLMKRSPYTTYDASSSTTDSSDYDDLISSVASSLTSSSSDSISESLNLPNWAGAVNACKGATAVAALNWVLFIATTYAVVAKIRMLSKAGSGGPQPTDDYSNGAFNARADDNSFETDKHLHKGNNAV